MEQVVLKNILNNSCTLPLEEATKVKTSPCFFQIEIVADHSFSETPLHNKNTVIFPIRIE
jgi:hypothetical protein